MGIPTMKKLPIPVREPELIRAEADRLHGGNVDKVATTNFYNIGVGNVLVRSRYQKADEMETMREMLLTFPIALRGGVHELYCDSETKHRYIAYVRRWSPEQWMRRRHPMALDIAKHLANAAVEIVGGHNGIEVSDLDHEPADPYVTVEPDWQTG